MTTPEQTEALVWRLRRTLIQLTNGRQPVLTSGARMGLDEIERKVLAAVRRDNTASPDRDGHRRNSIGGGRGTGPAIVVEDENGQPDTIPVTTVEAAALARLEHGATEDDPHHALTDTAVSHLAAAAHAIDKLTETLDAIDALANTSRHSNPGGTCIACGRHVEGTPDDRLRRGLCAADYRAWLRAGSPDITYTRTQGEDRAAGF